MYHWPRVALPVTALAVSAVLAPSSTALAAAPHRQTLEIKQVRLLNPTTLEIRAEALCDPPPTPVAPVDELEHRDNLTLYLVSQEIAFGAVPCTGKRERFSQVGQVSVGEVGPGVYQDVFWAFGTDCAYSIEGPDDIREHCSIYAGGLFDVTLKAKGWARTS